MTIVYPYSANCSRINWKQVPLKNLTLFFANNWLCVTPVPTYALTNCHFLLIFKPTVHGVSR